jgi:hypothetical protein
VREVSGEKYLVVATSGSVIEPVYRMSPNEAVETATCATHVRLGGP